MTQARAGLGATLLAVACTVPTLVQATPVSLPPLRIDPSPGTLKIDPGSVALPNPTGMSIRGPWLPGDDIPKPVILHVPEIKSVTGGPQPPRDNPPDAIQHAIDRFIVPDSSIHTLKFSIIAPNARWSVFTGIEAQLEAATPGLDVQMEFLQPGDLANCVATVGVPGPGGVGGGFIDTCDPQTPPARTPGVAELVYLGLFDWTAWPGSDSSLYVYSLVNRGAMLYLDAQDVDPTHIDPSIESEAELAFLVKGLDLGLGPNRSFNLSFVEPVQVPYGTAPVPVPAPIWLLSLWPLALGLHDARKRRIARA